MVACPGEPSGLLRGRGGIGPEDPGAHQHPPGRHVHRRRRGDGEVEHLAWRWFSADRAVGSRTALLHHVGEQLAAPCGSRSVLPSTDNDVMAHGEGAGPDGGRGGVGAAVVVQPDRPEVSSETALQVAAVRLRQRPSVLAPSADQLLPSC